MKHISNNGNALCDQFNSANDYIVDTKDKSDCADCKNLASYHLGGMDSDTLCGTKWFDPKKLTAIALEADCENCRAHPTVMVGPVGQLGCARRASKTWEPEPIKDVDEVLAAVEKRKR